VLLLFVAGVQHNLCQLYQNACCCCLWLLFALAGSCCSPASAQTKQSSHPSCHKPLMLLLLVAGVDACKILLLACQHTDQAELAS
jgi:hypothetical protein